MRTPSESREEQCHRGNVVVAEGGRIAGVPADGRGAVSLVNRAQPNGDVGHRLLPAGFFETAVG